MRFKFIRQKDAMQCGVASLCMICNYMGLKCTPEWLERICHTTKQGVSLKSISDAAKGVGLKACGLRLSLNKLSECQLPAILHWNQNHFVVLYNIDNKNNKFWIADPAKGKFKATVADMERHWSSSECGDGIAMFFERGPSFGKSIDDSQAGRSPFDFLWKYIMQYSRHFLQIFLGLLLGCVLQLIMPFLTQWIVDIGIAQADIKLIWLILLGELMIVAGRTATDFIRRWLLMHISMRINVSLVSDFFIKLMKLPMSFFDTKLMGDLLQRIGDHSRVQTFLTGQVLGMMFTILSFVVFGVVLFIYNRIIFGVFIIGSLVYGLWIANFLSRRKVLDYELFEQQSINQNRTYELVNSMQEIKLQGCENRRRWEWEDTQADLFGVQMKSLKLQQAQEAGSVFINEIKNILITVMAATAVIGGEISLGAMLAIQYIVGQLNSPVEQLMQFVYSLQDVKISLERINQIHETTNEESAMNALAQFGPEKSISISGLCYKYDLHAPTLTLEDVSMEIPQGKVTAIVGASGSGKTTLIKLILGYYTPLSGNIYVAGHDINGYDLKWWRSRCGVVMQDGVIFSESIGRNIAVDDGSIDDERLIKAAEIACIREFVESLPLKFDTKVGRDGIGLSQGQRQRILIARAVYRNPDFIFLDEATNSLDAENEKNIVERLEEFYRGRTVVVVAHRLSTVRNAHNIVVMDGGRIAESGAHSQLIANKGVYYNLVKNQLELGS